MTESFLSCGLGHGAMETFGENMGMEVMSSRAFTQHINALLEDIKRFKSEILAEARQMVRETLCAEDPTLKAKELLDILVSFDGSWQRRGFSSLYGIGFVIEVTTGLIINFVVLSKYCYSSLLAEKSYEADTDAYRKWKEEHKNSYQCNKNYEGSSSAMEMAAAAILWGRSEADCKMHTEMLSDGDSKTHSHLLELKPYGPEIEIKEEECINHVSKRLPTALKKIVNDCKVKKVTLGGSGEGQLTERAMTKLASYYRKALEENSDNIENMKKAVFASLHHCSSTDQNPNHSLCPKGKSSW